MEGVIWAAVKVCEVRASWRQRMESSISAPPSRRGGAAKRKYYQIKRAGARLKLEFFLPHTIIL